jgi:hypothetical protein
LAIPHFLEALRIEPELASAREGLIDALKARSWVFRWPWLFIASVGKGRKWAHCVMSILVLVTFLMARALVRAPEIQLEGAFVIIAGAVALMSSVWFAGPLMHLFLMLHPVGRHAMSDRQVQSAIWVTLVTFAAFLAFGAWALGIPFGRDSALVLVGLIAPLAALSDMPPGPQRGQLAVFTAVLAAFGFTTGIRSALNGAEVERRFWMAYFVGALAILWIGAYLKVEHFRKQR